MGQERYIGESQMKGQPTKKLQFFLKDESVDTKHIKDDAVTERTIGTDAVTTNKIKNKQVTLDKIDDNLRNIITTSAGQHGIPLSLEFGNSDDLGITQRVLTESRNNLQAQIDAIVGGDAPISFTASVNTTFAGGGTTVTLTASSPNVLANTIGIWLGTNLLADGSNIYSLTYSFTAPSTPGSTTYTAKFNIKGIQKEATRTVTAVYRIYYGALAEYDSESLTGYGTATTTAARTYKMRLDSTPRHIYFKVPKVGVSQVSTVELLSDGNYSPVIGRLDASLGDADYNVWVSDDTYSVDTAGDRDFVVNR